MMLKYLRTVLMIAAFSLLSLPQANAIESMGGGGGSSGAALTYFTVSAASHSSASMASNVIGLCTFDLPATVTFGHMGFYVFAADSGASKYDWGIYSGNAGGTGTLKADVGADASNGFSPLNVGGQLVDRAVRQGTVTLTAGHYYAAWTGNGSGGQPDGMDQNPGSGPVGGSYHAYCNHATGIASTNGSLPATLTLPADSINYGFNNLEMNP